MLIPIPVYTNALIYKFKRGEDLIEKRKNFLVISFISTANTQNINSIFNNVKKYPIIADSKTKSSLNWINKAFGKFHRIFLASIKAHLRGDALLNFSR